MVLKIATSGKRKSEESGVLYYQIKISKECSQSVP